MEGKDFRVGDKVTRLIIQQGIIENDMSFNNNIVDKKYWYHGHNLDVVVTGEEIPKRMGKRYVNLYWNEDKRHLYSQLNHRTKDAAISRAGNAAIVKGLEIEVPEPEADKRARKHKDDLCILCEMRPAWSSSGYCAECEPLPKSEIKPEPDPECVHCGSKAIMAGCCMICGKFPFGSTEAKQEPEHPGFRSGLSEWPRDNGDF